jgi:hypothetical protein
LPGAPRVPGRERRRRLIVILVVNAIVTVLVGMLAVPLVHVARHLAHQSSLRRAATVELDWLAVPGNWTVDHEFYADPHFGGNPSADIVRGYDHLPTTPKALRTTAAQVAGAAGWTSASESDASAGGPR